MKLSWKLWLLGVALAISLVAIMAGSSSMKLVTFLVCIGYLAIISYSKSRVAKIVLTFVFIGVVALLISNSIQTGAVVKSVETNSSVFNAGLRQGEIITQINGKQVTDKQTYSDALNTITIGDIEKSVTIKTKTNTYVFLTNQSLPITVDNVPKTNVQTGLDLRGGARALVQPDVKITDAQMQDLVEVSRNRFNVYGLSDVNIQPVSDLDRNNFMLVEVAGATPNDLENLIAQQGKFEAKVGNTSVFEGGKKDISDVCRNDQKCAAITQCFPAQTGFGCNFAFTIYLTDAAAKKHASVTKNLSLDSSGKYLTDKLYLYVDDKLVDSLLISSDLRGQVATQIQIQGSGSGATQDEAIKDARASMNKLQTVLLTGSLPFKLSIVKLDTISPTLGGNFVYSILLTALVSILAVSVIIFARYRKLKISLALLLTSFSELLIILGVASIIRWNLDIPSIAGILATIGTGVDQQIIIMDEASHSKSLSIIQRLKRASGIILGSYFALLAAMIPLYWAGAGLFKGFALTTIIGVTAGVLITRPAFADIVKKIEG